jgi:hypothetical protein
MEETNKGNGVNGELPDECSQAASRSRNRTSYFASTPSGVDCSLGRLNPDITGHSGELCGGLDSYLISLQRYGLAALPHLSKWGVLTNCPHTTVRLSLCNSSPHPVLRSRLPRSRPSPSWPHPRVRAGMAPWVSVPGCRTRCCRAALDAISV